MVVCSFQPRCAPRLHRRRAVTLQYVYSKAHGRGLGAQTTGGAGACVPPPRAPAQKARPGARKRARLCQACRGQRGSCAASAPAALDAGCAAPPRRGPAMGGRQGASRLEQQGGAPRRAGRPRPARPAAASPGDCNAPRSGAGPRARGASRPSRRGSPSARRVFNVPSSGTWCQGPRGPAQQLGGPLTGGRRSRRARPAGGRRRPRRRRW